MFIQKMRIYKIWDEDLLTEHRWIYCFAHQMIKTSSIFCGFYNKSFFAFSLLKNSIKQIIPGCMYFNSPTHQKNEYKYDIKTLTAGCKFKHALNLSSTSSLNFMKPTQAAYQSNRIRASYQWINSSVKNATNKISDIE